MTTSHPSRRSRPPFPSPRSDRRGPDPRSREARGRETPSPGRPAPSRLTGLAPSRPFVPDPFVGKALDLLPVALNAAMPLRAAHRADLPDAVRELSSILTTDRGALSRPYWTSPRLVSAYLRYFLPWNLLRLHRLFRMLPVPAPAGDAPTMLDLGSGPLSVPIALWLSDPAWRRAGVRLVCADTSPHPMELGETILRKLASVTKEPLTWEIRLVRQPLLKALALQRTPPTLITAANVLNEWEGRGTDADDTLADRMADLAEATAGAMGNGSSALFVEPGTRLGGTLCAHLRTAAMRAGLNPVAPCTHRGECPLLGRRDRGWCHLHDGLAATAPSPWLARLAEQARLAKSSLSSAYMMLSPRRPGVPAPGEEGTRPVPSGPTEIRARLLSDAFLVPELGLARYACSERGLLLIAHAARHAPGSVVRCGVEARPRVDRKSGAVVAEILDRP